MSENTTVKVIENIDSQFYQIEVNGETFTSDKVTETAVVPKKKKKATAQTPSVTEAPAVSTCSTEIGEDVKAVELNSILHNFKDEVANEAVQQLSSDVLNEVTNRQEKDADLQSQIDAIGIDIREDVDKLKEDLETETSERMTDDEDIHTLIDNLESDITSLTERLDALKALVPDQATEENQLADKDFVNSSISTNTANYIYKTDAEGDKVPFESIAELEAYSGTVTNNDYAFVTGTDESGNIFFDRYKADVDGSTVTWAKEYRLNNSSFTEEQWKAVNSGITEELVEAIGESKIAEVNDIRAFFADKEGWYGFFKWTGANTEYTYYEYKSGPGYAYIKTISLTTNCLVFVQRERHTTVQGPNQLVLDMFVISSDLQGNISYESSLGDIDFLDGEAVYNLVNSKKIDIISITSNSNNYFPSTGLLFISYSNRTQISQYDYTYKTKYMFISFNGGIYTLQSDTTDMHSILWSSTNKLNVDGTNATETGTSNIVHSLGIATGDVTDNTEFITSNANGYSTSDTKYYRRTGLRIWNYIKSKLKLSGTSESYRVLEPTYNYISGTTTTYWWWLIGTLTGECIQSFDIFISSDANYYQKSHYKLDVSCYSNSSYSISLQNITSNSTDSASNIAVALTSDGEIYIQCYALWVSTCRINRTINRGTFDYACTQLSGSNSAFGTPKGFTSVKTITRSGSFKYEISTGNVTENKPVIFSDISGNANTADTATTAYKIRTTAPTNPQPGDIWIS